MLGVAAFGQKKEDMKTFIRYDGIYQSVGKIEGEKVTYHYLRFFSDGVVYSHYSTLPYKDIKKMLDRKNKSAEQGMYEMTEEHIYFTITGEQGTIVYDGQISEKYYLDILGKNLATGASGKERYYFIKTKGK